ncbi:MAG: thiamine-phosphate kinase [Candidatus Puniceispirillales bacterium]
MDEFDYIKKYFKPLTNEFARGLKDDAAVYKPLSNHEIVITTDSLVEGVHFFGSESPIDIAKKALRVNLSDIASMGAKPLFYNLALNIPKDKVECFISNFAIGLKEDQEEYKIKLIGGDLTSSLKNIHITISMFGHLPFGEAVSRSNAKAGDFLFVTGKLGLSKIGLENFFSKPALFIEAKKKYLLPKPRVELGILLRNIASSMIDVSDGLVQDSLHLASNSGLSLEIDIDSLPLPICSLLNYNDIIDCALYGGDDYELLFSCNPQDEELVKKLSLKTNVEITKIGIFRKSNNHKLTFKGTKKKPKNVSYKHF